MVIGNIIINASDDRNLKEVEAYSGSLQDGTTEPVSPVNNPFLVVRGGHPI